jgi:hypothetical protein
MPSVLLSVHGIVKALIDNDSDHLSCPDCDNKLYSNDEKSNWLLICSACHFTCFPSSYLKYKSLEEQQKILKDIGFYKDIGSKVGRRRV